ncbi:hypothetical protein ABZ079_21980 [Streptomyces sp. NPDC006314]|uniref:hypothetical protein n=1 Tax=Streptomyces sp. NPDC006314 TaxID=3154475 RepID=UPI0033A177B6
MRLRKCTVAALFVAAALTSAAPQAVAAPMPWETSRNPAVTPHEPASRPAAGTGTVTILCGSPCYQ